MSIWAGGGQRRDNLFVFRRILTHPLPPPLLNPQIFLGTFPFFCSFVDDNGDDENVFLITLGSPHPTL